jgi:2-keto-3-deoxy-6-phosphogluconate aldolase
MTVSTNETDQTKINRAIQQLEQGRLNVGATCTLTPSATSTVVKAQNCGAGSQVQLTPKTANAAAALATTYVSVVANGSFTLTHASNAQTDRTFGFACLG